MSRSRAAKALLACAALAWLAASHLRDRRAADAPPPPSPEARHPRAAARLAAPAPPEIEQAPSVATATAASSGAPAQAGAPAGGLRGGSTIEGAVYDESDVPVAGAVVEVGRGLETSAPRVLAATTSSGPEGRFRLGPLRLSAAEVEVVARTGEARSEPLRFALLRAIPYDGALHLAAGATVVVRVLSSEGSPVPDAVLRAEGLPGAWAAAADAGRYVVRGVPPRDYPLAATDPLTGDAGDALLHVERPGALAETEVRLAAGPASGGRARIVVLAPGGAAVAGAAVLVYGIGDARDGRDGDFAAALSSAPGPLRDLAHAAGALLRLEGADADALRTRPLRLLTGDDGAVEARLRAGPLVLLALAGPGPGAPSGLAGLITVEAPPAGRAATLAAPVRPLGVVEGAVEAIPGAEPPAFVSLDQGGRRGLLAARVEDRRFAFDAVPAGAYVVSAEDPERRQAGPGTGGEAPGLAPAAVEVREGERAEVTLRAVAPSPLRVVVTQAGEPLLLSRVSVATSSDLGPPTHDDFPDSRAIRLSLLPGAHRVVVRGEARSGLRFTIAGIARVPTAEALALDLPAPGRLRIIPPDLSPDLGDGGVTLVSKTPDLRVDVVIPAGAVTPLAIEGVPAGRYGAPENDGVTLAPAEVVVPAGGEAEVRVVYGPPPG